MATRQWIEMPISKGAGGDGPAHPKYDVGTSAVLVYRGPKVYVGVMDGRTPRYPDVRVLSREEARQLEQSFPFPLPAPGRHGHAGPLRLGDLVSLLTSRAGISECRGCQRRRSLLNNVTVWGWWRRSRPASRGVR
jgi:hypothetical protein